MDFIFPWRSTNLLSVSIYQHSIGTNLQVCISNGNSSEVILLKKVIIYQYLPKPAKGFQQLNLILKWNPLHVKVCPTGSFLVTGHYQEEPISAFSTQHLFPSNIYVYINKKMLSILIFRVNNPNSLSFFSCDRCSIPFNISISFDWTQISHHLEAKQHNTLTSSSQRKG